MAGFRVVYKYYCQELDFTVSVGSEIMALLFDHRQTNWYSRESGGMLFTKQLRDHDVEINYITTPGNGDIRRRNYFRINEERARSIIQEQYEVGSHYLGDWHTHNEYMANPSGTDINSIHHLFNSSGHLRPFFLMLIIPNEINASHCYLGASDGSVLYPFFLR